MARIRVRVRRKPAVSEQKPPFPKLPDWCNVYDGLSDDELSELEQENLTRAGLLRSAE